MGGGRRVSRKELVGDEDRITCKHASSASVFYLGLGQPLTKTWEGFLLFMSWRSFDSMADVDAFIFNQS